MHCNTARQRCAIVALVTTAAAPTNAQLGIVQVSVDIAVKAILIVIVITIRRDIIIGVIANGAAVRDTIGGSVTLLAHIAAQALRAAEWNAQVDVEHIVILLVISISDGALPVHGDAGIFKGFTPRQQQVAAVLVVCALVVVKPCAKRTRNSCRKTYVAAVSIIIRLKFIIQRIGKLAVTAAKMRCAGGKAHVFTQR